MHETKITNTRKLYLGIYLTILTLFILKHYIIVNSYLKKSINQSTFN